jgi:hypothetical protein
MFENLTHKSKKHKKSLLGQQTGSVHASTQKNVFFK